jgi:hypothetical protein
MKPRESCFNFYILSIEIIEEKKKKPATYILSKRFKLGDSYLLKSWEWEDYGILNHCSNIFPIQEDDGSF